MIDIHCHILPEIDDGAENPDISLSMGRTAAENKISFIVATPHYSCSAGEDRFIERRNGRISFLRKMFAENDVDVKLLPGAEVYLNDDIYFDNRLEKLTVNDTRYLLTELDFTGVSIRKIVRYFEEILSRGMIPVLAHPERYEYFQKDTGLVNYLADTGTLFQVNATSLAGCSDSGSFRLAYEMVKNGMAAFIASDAHGIQGRHNNMLKYIRDFPEDIDKETLRLMLSTNPKMMLEDKDIAINFRHIK